MAQILVVTAAIWVAAFCADCSWSTLEADGSLPSQRCMHTMVEHNGALYVYGGGLSGSYIASSHRFTMSTATWDAMPLLGSYPDPRKGHSAVVRNGLIYVFGGEGGSSYFNDVHSLDVSTNTWTDLSSLSTGDVPTGRGYHCSVVYQDKMYTFGGSTDNSYISQLLEYNFDTHVWTAMPLTGNYPDAREHHACVVHGDNMYVIGGRGLSGGYTVLMMDVKVFNFISKTWSYGYLTGDTPSPVMGHKAVAYNNSLFMFGGYGGSSRGMNNDLHSYNVESKNWTRHGYLSAMLPMSYYASVLINDDMYIFGGSNQVSPYYYNDIRSLKLSTLCPWVDPNDDGGDGGGTSSAMTATLSVVTMGLVVLAMLV